MWRNYVQSTFVWKFCDIGTPYENKTTKSNFVQICNGRDYTPYDDDIKIINVKRSS